MKINVLRDVNAFASQMKRHEQIHHRMDDLLRSISGETSIVDPCAFSPTQGHKSILRTYNCTTPSYTICCHLLILNEYPPCNPVYDSEVSHTHFVKPQNLMLKSILLSSDVLAAGILADSSARMSTTNIQDR